MRLLNSLLAINLLIFSHAASSADLDTRMRDARNRQNTPQHLQQYLTDEDWQVRRELASNRRATAEMLQQLAGDPDKRVRITVITNTQTADDTHYLLASDPDIDVRSVVARYEYTSARVMAKLSSLSR